MAQVATETIGVAQVATETIGVAQENLFIHPDGQIPIIYSCPI